MNEIQTNNDTQINIRPIEVITQEINFYKQTAGAAVLEIGKRLNEAKAQLDHGEWGEWLEKKVEFSEASAQRFMRLAKEYTNSSPVTALGASKALILLALPEDERESFMEQTHNINGEEKTALEMSKRELEKAVKEKNDALRQAELAKMDVNELESKLSYQQKETEHLAETLKKTTDELEELKSRPVEVATLPLSDEDMEDIKKQAAEEKQKEIEQLKNKIEHLKNDVQKSKQAAKTAKEQIEAAKTAQDATLARQREENKKLSERIEELNKKLVVSSSGDMAEFKAYFENAKYSVNKMLEIADKTEENKKLKNALRAFCEMVIKTIGADE